MGKDSEVLGGEFEVGSSKKIPHESGGFFYTIGDPYKIKYNKIIRVR